MESIVQETYLKPTYLFVIDQIIINQIKKTCKKTTTSFQQTETRFLSISYFKLRLKSNNHCSLFSSLALLFYFLFFSVKSRREKDRSLNQWLPIPPWPTYSGHHKLCCNKWKTFSYLRASINYEGIEKETCNYLHKTAKQFYQNLLLTRRVKFLQFINIFPFLLIPSGLN